MSIPTSEKGHPGGFVSTYLPTSGRNRHTVTSDYDLTVELQWPNSIITYDKMRADPQIAGVLEAIAQPILNAEWDLITDDVPANVVEFVRTELGLYGPENALAQATHQGVSILEHIEEMTNTLLWAGFSVAEQTYTVAPPTPAQEGLELPGQVRHLRKLAPRPPRSITSIDVEKDGGLRSITQTPVNPMHKDIVIPVRQLVFYSHKKIGGAWEGQSILRPVYRPWAMKDMYLRLDLRAADLHSSGYWRGKTNDKKRAEELREILRDLRNGDESVLVHDSLDEVDLMGMNGSLIDIVERIKYFDQEISKSALAMFLDLGHDNGARSLGETHLRVFTTKVQAIANYIARIVTQHVIRDLVRFNFPEGTAYPVITPGDIRAQQGVNAETIKTLFDSGGLTYDRGIENYIRERNGLPELPDDLQTRDQVPQASGDPASNGQSGTVDTTPNPLQAVPVTTIAATEGQAALDRATVLYQQLKERVGA